MTFKKVFSLFCVILIIALVLDNVHISITIGDNQPEISSTIEPQWQLEHTFTICNDGGAGNSCGG